MNRDRTQIQATLRQKHIYIRTSQSRFVCEGYRVTLASGSEEGYVAGFFRRLVKRGTGPVVYYRLYIPRRLGGLFGGVFGGIGV